MIPVVNRCVEAGDAPCPTLFNQLDAIRGVVTAAVLTVVEPTCTDALDSLVTLPPFVLTPEDNKVIVYPESVSLERSKSKSPLLVTTRTKVTATIVVALSGYPSIGMDEAEGYITTPHPADSHAAAKFITGLGWCVWCALVDAINNKALLPNKELHDDIAMTTMKLLDFETGIAGLEIGMTWYA